MPNNRLLFNVTKPTLTIYPAAKGKGNGNPGFGMRKNNTSSDNWVVDFENWLKIRKFL